MKFWSNNNVKYPMPSAVASRVLEIPAQSSASERCFSGLTYLLNRQRNSIDKSLAGWPFNIKLYGTI